MELSELQCKFTEALAHTILFTKSLGFDVKIQELNRTIEQQRQYIKDGVSKTLDSRHIDKLAADLILFRNGVRVVDDNAYRPIGEFWETLGGRWGGRFGLEDQSPEIRAAKLGWDCDHFEFRKI